MNCEIKTILLLLTYRCNLHCKYCFYNIDDIQHSGIKDLKVKRDELTEDEIYKMIIQPAKELDVKRIIFSGGEPMIRKDICKLIHKSLDVGLDSILQTNLTLDISDLLSDEEIMRNMYFRVSLDGLEDKNDNERGTGSYNKTINNINKIIKYYKNHDIKSRLSINTVVTQNNISELSKHVESLLDIGVDDISLQLLSRNRFDNKSNLNKKDINCLIDNLNHIRERIYKKNIKFEVFPIEDSKINFDNLSKWYNSSDFFSWFGCSTLKKRLTISPYGDVFTCIEKPYASLKEKKMKDIIEDERLEFISYMLQNTPCQECFRCCNLEV